MRFRAPPREALPASTFDHPIYAAVQPWRELLVGSHWPSIASIDAAFSGVRHRVTGQALRVVAQTPELLADGLHYETRILLRGEIATRPACWHDLLNALTWLSQPALKSALNARQAIDVAAVGARTRTRGQCALTHFDEAGIVLLLRDADRLAAWDAHAWVGMLDGLAPSDVAVAIIGHALLEHALVEGQMLVGKALVALHPAPAKAMPRVIGQMADASLAQRVLVDPQELRPLPLVGLPGWHRLAGDPAFLREAACFQPKREGRCYPPPLDIRLTSWNAAA